MSRDKQTEIEEMAKDICDYARGEICILDDKKCDMQCTSAKIAKKLTAKGYRKQEWISVDERLPDIELHKAKAVVPDVLFPCLVVREGNIVSYIEKAWYWGAKFTTQDCTDITDSITHWMPLPEAPKMKGGAE